MRRRRLAEEQQHDAASTASTRPSLESVGTAAGARFGLS
jgi:hypothetical protein